MCGQTPEKYHGLPDPVCGGARRQSAASLWSTNVDSDRYLRSQHKDALAGSGAGWRCRSGTWPVYVGPWLPAAQETYSREDEAQPAGCRRAVEKHKRGSLVAMGLFALSPLPSAQLFEAVGLTGLRLVHFTAAFFAGRIVSYSIYAATAKGIEKTSMGRAFKLYLTSPVGIAIEVLMLGLLVALARVDWQKHLGGKGSQRQ